MRCKNESKKHQLDVLAQIRVTPGGIIPVISIVDLREKKG